MPAQSGDLDFGTVPTPAPQCSICGSTEGSTLRVREMMFGTRKGFDYFLCAGCGCCQRFGGGDAAEYPEDYYAFTPQPRPSGMRGALRRLRNHGVFRGNPVGLMLSALAPYPVPSARHWFPRMGVDITARVLDVGCGAGELVRDLQEAGFSRALGIDPLIPDEILDRYGSFIRRAWLHDMEGEHDVVMLHHVLEHMPDQRGALLDAARLLRGGGHLLIRIPIVPSHALETYGEHWVQFDAPRHLFIHSERSLTTLAQQAGLRLEHIEHDSTEFQFMGSELYRRDLPLSHLQSAFTPQQRAEFRRAARSLNRARRGDQAAFYFRKPADTSR